MFILSETPAGFALFKAKSNKLEKVLSKLEDPGRARKILKLLHFEKFSDTSEALKATSSLLEGKIPKCLKMTIKNNMNTEQHDQLLVADPKLGNAIKNKFGVQCVSNSSVHELMRCIRGQLDSLISASGVDQKEISAMRLGLAHCLSRYKLKYSADKVDTMVVHAIGLLDELDKELNNYVMRCREWYGWHFPELSKIVSDNIAYLKIVQRIGTRECVASTDLSDILPEDIEEKVKEAAEISMGTEIDEDDVRNVQGLCRQILLFSEYRLTLSQYVTTRIMTLAPNLAVLAGDMVGARLLANAKSLKNLALHPASTIQILGAEKALFRALKTKKQTPKYGIIYHAQLIGQCPQQIKAKMARSLAAKIALSVRADAFEEEDLANELGVAHKQKLQKRMQLLLDGNNTRLSGTGRARAQFEKYQNTTEMVRYPNAADSTLNRTSSNASAPTSKKRKFEDGELTLYPDAADSTLNRRTSSKTSAPTSKKRKCEDDEQEHNKKKRRKNTTE